MRARYIPPRRRHPRGTSSTVVSRQTCAVHARPVRRVPSPTQRSTPPDVVVVASSVPHTERTVTWTGRRRSGEPIPVASRRLDCRGVARVHKRSRRTRAMRTTVTAATFAVAAALACCRPSASGVRASCLRTADDLRAQTRASDVALKVLGMRSWPEPDGFTGGHFAVMAVYKGARIVKTVLRDGSADLYNIHDK